MRVAFIAPHSSESAYPEFIKTHRNPDDFDYEIVCNADSYVMKYCKAVQLVGIEPMLYYLSQYGRPVKEFRHKYGCEIKRIPVNIGGGNWSKEISFSLLRELSKDNFDLVHIFGYYRHWIYPDMYDILAAFCELKGYPLIAHYQTGSYPTRFFAKRWLKHLSIGFADKILSINRLELERLTNPKHSNYYGLKIAENKVIHIPNIVDTSNFYPTPKDLAAKKLNKNPNKRYVLFVGRLTYEKGVQHLTNIMPELLRDFINTELIVIGDGTYKTELEKLAERRNIENYVSFIGFVPNDKLKWYYNLADIHVLPSYSESFGAVLIEALACNTPSIGTNVGGIPEVLTNGVGILVSPKNEKELLNAIKTVFNGKFNIDQGKRKEKLQEYSLDNIGKRLKEIYIEILKEKNREII